MKKTTNPWRRSAALDLWSLATEGTQEGRLQGKNHEGYNCFSCCPDNPIGLHMAFYEYGDYIISNWHPEHRSTLSLRSAKNYQGYTVQLNVKFFDERSCKADYRKAVPTTEPELTIRAKVSKQVRNLAYISAEITNSKGGSCNEGEAIYFLMNQEKAKIIALEKRYYESRYPPTSQPTVGCASVQ